MRRSLWTLTLPAAALAFGMSGATATAESLLSTLDRDALHKEFRAYLLENPEVVRDALLLLEERRMADEAQREQEMVAANDGRIHDDGFSYVGGNPDGDITIVEFQDYRCGYCKRAHGEVAELVESDGNIRLIVKEFPILGPDSVTASRAAVATLITQGGDSYKALTDALMTFNGPINDQSLEKIGKAAGVDMAATNAAMDDPEVTRRITETRELAQALSISGTPTFVIGGRLVKGYLPLESMREVVETVRLKADQ